MSLDATGITGCSGRVAATEPDSLSQDDPGTATPPPTDLRPVGERPWREDPDIMPDAREMLRALADSWPITAEVLTSTGREWDESQIRMDLLWWDDQQGHPNAAHRLRWARPGVRTLAARWGITYRVARRIVRAHDGRTEGAPRAQEGRTTPPESASDAEKIAPPTSYLLPPASKTDHAREVWEAWRAMGHDQGPGSSTLRKADRQVVEARLREDSVEDVILVLRWAHEDPRSWWRQQGALGLATLCRAKGWSDRLEQAYRWSHRQSAPAPAASQVDARAIYLRLASGAIDRGGPWHPDPETDRRLKASARGLVDQLKGNDYEHARAIAEVMRRWEVAA